MNSNTILKSVVTTLFVILIGTNIGWGQDATHTVETGETLFSIAQQYDLNVQQIKDWNNIENSEELSVGQSLIIKRESGGAGDPEDGITHTVEKQETLFSISKQYNVSIAEIKSWNNLSSDNLSVGQDLLIYPSESQASQQQSIVVNDDAQQNTYYTVKSGDSLYRIAEAHEMSVDELKELNGLTSNNIRVGQRLTVRGKDDGTPPSVAATADSSPQGKFISYEISSQSENLQDILKKFHMDKEEFQALNPGAGTSQFRSGQTVTVLAPPNRTYQNPYLTNNNTLENLGTSSASQYGTKEKAKTTTNGELYNPEALTGAHSNISLGSIIYVENPENKKGVYVRINDRNSGNGLKLSAAAWNALDFGNSTPKVTIYQN